MTVVEHGNDMNVSLKKFSSSELFLPAFRFSLRSAAAIIALSVIPAILGALAAAIQEERPLRPQGLFLILVLSIAACAWQLSAIGFYVIERVRGEQSHLLRTLLRALHFLPKVFLSYAAVIACMFGPYLLALLRVSISGGERMLFVMLTGCSFLFLWAPAFVIGELAVKPSKEDEEEEEDEDYLDDDEYLVARPRKFAVFRGRSLLDFGLGRSFQFSARHFGLTLELLVLLWTVKVLPGAVVHLNRSALLPIPEGAFEEFFSVLAAGFVYCAAAGVFLSTLPREATDELGIEASPLSLYSRVRPSRVRVALSRVFFLLLAVLAVCSTGFLLQSFLAEQKAPVGLTVESSVKSRSTADLTVTIALDDHGLGFRWFDPSRIRLRAAGKNNVAPEISNTLPAIPILEGTAPDREVLFSDSQDILDDRFFKPYYGKLKLELRFPLVDKSLTGPLEVIHRSLSGSDTKLLDIPEPAAKGEGES